MNYLEVKHLRMIRSIAETGNMTRAAERLFLTQSALSQQLRDIEGKLKVDLFHRTPRKMILTAAGKKLIDTAGHVIDALEDAELDIAKQVSGDRGELKVGTQCIFCYKWLPRVMKTFQEKFPNIEFEIGTSEDPFQDLETRRYDLVITVGPPVDSTYSFSPLFKDQLICILPQSHALSTRPYIRLEDFRDLDLISHAEKAKNRFYQNMLRPNAIEPKRLMTVGQSQAIIELVASGFGISVFPRWAVRTAIGQIPIVARPITAKGVPVTWYAVSLRNGKPPIFLTQFLSIVAKTNPVSAD